MLLRARALPGLVGWGVRFLANCRAGALARKPRAILALARFSADQLASCSAGERSPSTATRPACSSCSATSCRWPAPSARAGLYGELGLPLRAARRGGLRRGRAGPGPDPRADHRRPPLPRRRQRRRLQFTRELWPRGAPTLGRRASASARRCRAWSAKPTASPPRPRRRRPADGRRLRPRRRAVERRAGPHGSACACRSIPAKGYSITVTSAAGTACRAARSLDDGRKVAVVRSAGGCGSPARSSSPAWTRASTPRRGREPRRPRWPPSCPTTRATAPSRHWAGLRPMTPGRPAAARPHPARQPLPQHRPRPARLDPGLRLRRGRGDLVLGRSRRSTSPPTAGRESRS